jgi:hypothetical protein
MDHEPRTSARHREAFVTWFLQFPHSFATCAARMELCVSGGLNQVFHCVDD